MVRRTYPHQTYRELMTFPPPEAREMQGTKRIVQRVIEIAVIMSVGAMAMPATAQAAPQRRLSVADAVLVEGDAGSQALSFRITYKGKSTTGVTVDYATAPASATAGSDYTSVAGTAALPSGGCKCTTIVVDVLGDLDEEAAETFQVNLSNPVKAMIFDGQGIGTVYDNDGAPSIVVFDAVANEADGSASFDVALTSTDIDIVSVDLTTVDGTALAGNDYTTTIATVTFVPGDLVETVSVPLLDDGVAEEEQYFTVALSNALGGAIDRAQALGTIVDNDPEPALSVGDVSVAEGDAGSSIATVTVALLGASELTVEVDYATSDAGAEADLDYTPSVGTLTFAPGDMEETVDVTVLADTTHEGDEGVAIDLSGELNATLADAGGLLTIADDDALPTLSIDDVSATEGDAGTTLVTFTVTKSGATALAATANWSTADGTASSGSDYTSASGSLSFAAADTTKVVQVEVLGDLQDEVDEQFSVTVADPTNAMISDDTGVATITDDDGGTLPTALTLRASKRTKQVVARGVLEAAENGSQVRVTFQVRRGGQYRKVAAKTVVVTRLADRDTDTIADAAYIAKFRRPAHGRYRFRVVFTGNVLLERCSKAVRFRL